MQGIARNQNTYLNITNLQEMFEKATKNYAYRLLELEMTIDETGLSIGRTKKQDISELIQLYMIGVQVLESTGDSRFGYFRTKLHDLMLKKEVVRQLKFTTPEDIIKKEKTIRDNKRKEHQSKLAKSEQQQTKQLNSILHTATTTVENYKESVQNALKKQQNQIKQRLNSRTKRPETANNSIPKTSFLKTGYGGSTATGSPFGQYYSSPQALKAKKQALGLQVKVLPTDGSPLEKEPVGSPIRIQKPSIIPRKSEGI